MWFEIGFAKAARCFGLPDIAHHAAAVARGVRVKDENWEVGDAVTAEIAVCASDADQFRRSGHGAPFFRRA